MPNEVKLRQTDCLFMVIFPVQKLKFYLYIQMSEVRAGCPKLVYANLLNLLYFQAPHLDIDLLSPMSQTGELFTISC